MDCIVANDDSNALLQEYLMRDFKDIRGTDQDIPSPSTIERDVVSGSTQSRDGLIEYAVAAILTRPIPKMFRILPRWLCYFFPK